MKFIAYVFASILLLSLCNNSEPLLDKLGIISITQPNCGAASSPAVACAFTAGFYAYISLICRSLYTSGNAAEIATCLVDIVPAPWDTIFSSIFGGIANGTLVTAENCSPTFDIWNSQLDPLCPSIFGPVLDIFEAVSVGGPLGMACGTEGNAEIACLIIEGYSLTEKLLCALDSTAINPVEFVTCLTQKLFGNSVNIATAMLNGLLNGLKITGSPCEQAIQFFDNSVEQMCPGLFDRTNESLKEILDLINF